MIEETIMEKFKLNLFEETYDDILVEDGAALAEQWITEAQEGANKQNIFQKIWGLIKKFFSWIAKKLSQLWKWLVSKFKKKEKTADQCVAEVVGMDEFDVKKKLNESTITESESDTIKDISKDILVQFNNDNTFKIYYMIESSSKDGSRWSIKSDDLKNQSVSRPAMLTNDMTLVGIIIFGAITYYKGLKDAFKDLINTLNGNDPKQVIDAMDKINEKCTQAEIEYITPGKRFEATLSLEGFKEAMDLIVSINDSLTHNALVDSALKSNNINDINVSNTFCEYLRRIQYGINTLTAALNSRYQVDLTFRGCVHDSSTLDKIVYNLINGGIPSKYVSHNVAIIVDSKMNTMGVIPMGQTRGCLYPADKSVVYKFALNTVGMRDNKFDIEVSNRCKNETIIAKVIKAEEKYCVYLSERLNTSIDSDMKAKIAENLINIVHMPNFQQRTGLQIRDIHRDNVGVRADGSPAILDYGNVTFLRK